MLLRVIFPDHKIIVDGEAYDCSFQPHELDLVALEWNDEANFVFIGRSVGDSCLLRGKAIKPLRGHLRAYLSAWERGKQKAKDDEQQRLAAFVSEIEHEHMEVESQPAERGKRRKRL